MGCFGTFPGFLYTVLNTVLNGTKDERSLTIGGRGICCPLTVILRFIFLTFDAYTGVSFIGQQQSVSGYKMLFGTMSSSHQTHHRRPSSCWCAASQTRGKLLVYLMLSLSGLSQAICADEATVIQTDGTLQVGTFQGWDETQLHLLDIIGKEVSASLNQVKAVSWRDRLQEHFGDSDVAVQLTNGDVLFVEQVATRDELVLIYLMNQLAEIPLEFVRSISFGSHAQHWMEPEFMQGESDAVLLLNGDLVHGDLVGLTPAKIVIFTEVGELALALDTVRTVLLSSTLTKEISRDREFVEMILKNGSVLSAQQLKFVEAEGSFAVQVSPELHISVPASLVCHLEVWQKHQRQLSHMRPVRFQSEDFWGNAQSFHRNRNFSRQLLISGQQVYGGGFGVHSRCEMVFEVPPQAVSFVTIVALDSRAEVDAAVDAFIDVDSKVAWKRSVVSRGESSLVRAEIDVTNASTLSLRIDFGSRANVGDLVNWCRPYFVIDQ